jgi:hypothetical protein
VIRSKRRIALFFALLATVFAVAGLASSSASATSLTCTQTKNAFTTPYGCGGLQFQQFTHGVLDMSADGNWWDAPVRATTENQTGPTAPRQDWYVFADTNNNPVTQGGEGDLGDYVAMFAPNGVIPGGCDNGLLHHQACNHTNLVVSNSPSDFCLSVENVPTIVRGHHTFRWFAVLRNCFTGDSRDEGTPQFTLGSDLVTDAVNTVSNPNHYQVWAPVLGQTDESLVNEALLHPEFRHGVGGNARYVLDIQAGGPSGSRLLAYPFNGGLNQVVVVLGCQPPVTLISGLAQVCP